MAGRTGAPLRLFGELLRSLRHAAGQTQEELAARSGVSGRTIADVERGRVTRPHRRTVELLAKALELTGAERSDFERAARDPYRSSLGTSAAAAAGLSRGPDPEVVPGQLPADVKEFSGREDELARLDALLPPVGDDRGSVVICGVSGMAGVGKTSLAIHWAHRVAHQFSDGQLYVNLRGFTPGEPVVALADAIRGFLDAFGIMASRLPSTMDAQAALFRSLMAGRRMLVVLDNARDVEQVRPLLPGSPGCMVLVTSRDQLTGLVTAAGAELLHLDLPSVNEAQALLTSRLGEARVAAEPAAVNEIIASCARLPLALAVVAARAVTYPGLSLARLAEQLRESPGRLDAFDAGDATTDVRSVFACSYHTLSPPAASLFRVLGLHPGPDAAEPAVASLAGVPVTQVRPLVAELVRAHLVMDDGTRRYAFHDLLRVYAREVCEATDTGDDRRKAIRRLLDHYLHTGCAATRYLEPGQPVAVEPAAPGVTPADVNDHARALAWFTTERSALVGAVRLAVATGFDSHTWRLAWTLIVFFNLQGHWHDLDITQRAALAAGERLADAAVQGRAHQCLGAVCTRSGRYQQAHAHLERALDLFGEAGDLLGQAHCQLYLADLLEQQSRHREAVGRAQRALELYRTVDHAPGQADALNTIGWCLAKLGEPESALDLCRQALDIQRTAGTRRGEGAAWDSVGYIHQQLHQYAEALSCYRRALHMFREIGNRYYEADTLTHVGEAHHALGDLNAARDSWRQALEILDELGHPQAAAVRSRLKAARSWTGAAQ